MEMSFNSSPTIIYDSIPSETIGWGIDLVQAPKIWPLTKGEGIKVAVLDTGIDYRHPDLKDNFKDGINLTSAIAGDYLDQSGHGTHCAGVIAASDNGFGIVGVAPEAELYAIKALDKNGEGSLHEIIEGIEWAIKNKMDILSMSIGASRDPGPKMHDAIKRAREAGVIIVCAAGNQNSRVNWPAAYRETIAVGAIDKNMNKASFSNFGEEVDVVAPGVNILSTYPNNKYSVLSGTSMAVPLVSGAIALIQSYARKIGEKATPEYILDIIQDKSTSIKGESAHYGNGLLNVYEALKDRKNCLK